MSSAERGERMEISQDLLCLVCNWLAAHGYTNAREGYEPSMERFRDPRNGSTITPEEYAYLLFANPEQAPREFRAAFIEPPTDTGPEILTATLRAAGFPAIVATRAPMSTPPERGRIEAWADRYGEAAPWLWVMGGSSTARSTVLAWAAIDVSNAMGAGVPPVNAIVYKHARDLCEEVNSADMYGENSKHNAMKPYKACALLILDGMGEERHAARELDTIRQVVDARSRNLLPTVFASTMGLKDWAGSYRSIDHTQARKTAAQITEGLCGFAEGLSKPETAAAVAQHVIGLGRATRA